MRQTIRNSLAENREKPSLEQKMYHYFCKSLRFIGNKSLVLLTFDFLDKVQLPSLCQKPSYILKMA